MTMRNILTVFLISAALASAQGPRRAPGFALPDTKYLSGQPGGKFHDLADYRGKVLVLEFMQTTCPHCNAFADILAQIAPKYGDKVAVLAVTNLNTDRPEQVAQYVSGHKIAYPVVMDQGQMMFSYILNPKGADVPHVYVIDPAGYIRADYVYDFSTRDIFEGKGLFAEIDKVLGKK
jgi:thiol-disulfide isomerase/thioredoxin